MERQVGWVGVLAIAVLPVGNAWAQVTDETGVSTVETPSEEAPAPDAPVDDVPETWNWLPAEKLTLDGVGWPERAAPFARLPLDARDLVGSVAWNAGRAPAGMAVRFESDAAEILVRWTLSPAFEGQPESTSRLAGGLDLYMRTVAGEWRWMSGASPSHGADDHVAALAVGLDGESHEYLLYLPALRGLRQLELGVPVDATINPGELPAGGAEFPIVLYGGAPIQGAGASRPGTTLAAQLGRRLRRPVVGLGLFGGGDLEMTAGALLAEVNASVIVLDVIAQCDAAILAERLVPFVQGLRAARPRTQLLLVEGPTPPAVELLPSLAAEWDARRAALVAAVETLQADGTPDIYLLTDGALIGSDGEGTVDGYLPNDLGHTRYATALEKAVGPLLNRWEEQRPGR